MIIDKIRDYIMTCPYLEDYAKVNVDFLPDNPDSFSIEPTPTDPVLKRYLDGSLDLQYTFVFASRVNYSDEIVNNINNSEFFEKFQDWLFLNTENDILPDLGENMKPISIEAISSGYMFDIAGNLRNARYQIQCRLIYCKEK